MSDEPGAYTYMLRCADGSYYVGTARRGLDQRIGEHNAGTYGGYTSSRRPVVLIWAQHFLIITATMQSSFCRSVEVEPPPVHREEPTGCGLPPFETLRFAPFLRVRWVCSDPAETFTSSERRQP